MADVELQLELDIISGAARSPRERTRVNILYSPVASSERALRMVGDVDAAVDVRQMVCSLDFTGRFTLHWLSFSSCSFVNTRHHATCSGEMAAAVVYTCCLVVYSRQQVYTTVRTSLDHTNDQFHRLSCQYT
jgi:hypothetical protein